MRHVVVAAALVREGRVLLCHRSPQREWYPNLWDFPGGHVESGEDPLDALCREVVEELGVSLARGAMSPHPTLHLDSPDLDMSIWTVTAWSGEPTNVAPAEHDRLGWFDGTAAVALPLAHASYPAFLATVLG